MSRAPRGQPVPPSALVTGYRPWLDGVRAVAVLLVVAQHALGSIPFDLSSGGVGMFFALSGYLITSLLLDERALKGAVSLGRFYLRRAARLFPALLLVVLVCNVIFLIQGDYDPLQGSPAAITYTANYALIVQSDLVQAYGPTWTLAVEEHFYLLWPLVLLGLTNRYGLRTALKATLAICVAALLWRAVLAAAHAPISLLQIGSFERADALLYGCAAAIALRLGWRPRPWMVWAGLAVVASTTFAFNEDTYTTAVFESAAIALGAAAVVVGLDYAAPAALRRCLSFRAIVYVGVLSYSIYLWHGPLMRVAKNMGYSSVGWRAVAALVSIGVAAASYRCLEKPIRTWARRRSDGRAAPDLAAAAAR